ncbi:branched-chain amino acid ABC transporter permease [Candidatus Woesearchaeota archaeon]|nr:branched-chain amino acid ABC transporter permease [Candidatus Woesearchaeota archaeon]
MAFADYIIHLGILTAIYMLAALALNLAIGFTGMLSLGHVAFFGIGAYTSALLGMHGWPIWLGILAGCGTAAAFGALLAIPTTRLKGDYLALATLGFAFIVESVSRNWEGLTRGALGIPGVQKLASSNALFLAFVILIVAAVYALSWQLVRTRFGLACQAIRDDELAARMLGVNSTSHKTIMFAISAGIAGLAGGLYVHYVTFVDPTIFSIGDLVILLSMVIVGGLASIPGSAVGALVFLLPEPLRFIGLPSSLLGPVREMLFALILLAILVWRPVGILGKVDVA